MTNANENENQIKITCPACGLLCDDISISASLQLASEKACSKAVDFFKRASTQTDSIGPTIAGIPCDLNTAISKAVDILTHSSQPLFAGLGTEVNGMRALVHLAQKTNATLDHMHSDFAVHNTRAMQNSGWMTTTFAEIKNRADVILAIGTDIISSHPRFFERFANSNERLSNNASPEVIYLGATGEYGQSFQTRAEQLPEIINVVNTLLNGRKIQAKTVAGISVTRLQTLSEKLKRASYTAVVWSAASLNSRHADLAIQSVIQLIAKLNETTRAAGLPLTSGDGDSSVNNVCTWLSGYPTRLRFNAGIPEYNSYTYSTETQLKNVDALLWISTFNPTPPPQTKLPSIVIGHPTMQFEQQPEVFIPVGVPGVDHGGLMFRMDGSITLPLKKVRHSPLPSLNDVIAKIEKAMTKAAMNTEVNV
jgi:formylmethanofuran dehydrogenase subunit B